MTSPFGALRPLVPALVLALGLGACVPDAGRPDRAATAFLTIADAELSRPSEGAKLDILVASTRLEDPFLRRTAVRALGRLENPALLARIEGLLADPAPTVRVAAANAMAQALHRADGTPALPALLARAEVETDPNVRAVLAQSLGRLTLTEAERHQVIATLLDMSFESGRDARPNTMIGVALGLESITRRYRGAPIGERALGRLSNLASYDLIEMSDRQNGPRVRLLAITAIDHAGHLRATLVEPALRDPDPAVRAAASGFLPRVNRLARTELIRRSLGDPSPRVRIGGIRQLAREPRNELNCTWITDAATRDETAAVRVLALDALAQPCPDLEGQVQTLLAAVSALGPETTLGWQTAAHALVSLAAVAPTLADAALPTFVAHPNPFVRSYAVRAAASLGRDDVLLDLANDPDANVRTATLQPLAAAGVAALDDIVRAQFAFDAPQLLMAAAALLVEEEAGVLGAESALEAFERISRAQRETWRDSRMALLAAIDALGDDRFADRLDPFLTDYDSAVAERVAGILTDWNGRPAVADPRPLPRLPLPSAVELRALAQTTVTLHMEGGGQIEIDPLPFLAPSNAYRFVRLAAEGYFDGLTFHRWAPNFVIQGGSPGANEYSGDRLYSRDEVGLLPHWRGTVGLSTRGHDTGDGQIFINIVENVRLDHDYTVYGVVQRGMDVVDRVLEGDVIARVEVAIR